MADVPRQGSPLGRDLGAEQRDNERPTRPQRSPRAVVVNGPDSFVHPLVASFTEYVKSVEMSGWATIETPVGVVMWNKRLRPTDDDLTWFGEVVALAV